MNIRRKANYALAAFASLLMSTAAWSDPIPGLYNTGVKANGQISTGDGDTDAHYTVNGQPSTTYRHPAYYVTSDSQWIGQLPGGTYSEPLVNGEATVYYTLNFDLTGLNPATAHIVGGFAADNFGTVLLNGVKISDTTLGFGGLTQFDITGNFKPGLNTLTFAITDYGPPAAFVVSGLSGTADKATPPSWTTTGWSAWSSTCGDATRTRTVTCISPDSGSTLSDESCQAASRPTASETSYQTSGCTFKWIEGAYGAPAPACGPTVSSRTVTCRRADGQDADASLCDPSTKPATETQSSDFSTCSFSWENGGWSAPSTTCGSATETRDVWCLRSDGTRVNVINESACGSGKPEASRTSYQTSGCGYSWKASPTWDAPVPACGATVENRSVTCERSDGQGAADGSCDPSTKPASQRAATNYATCGFSWEATPWSDPSKTCGSSTRTRSVTCVRSDGSTVADSSCTTERPATSETVADYSTCSYAWTYSAFGEPVAACGASVRTRTATCLRQDGVQSTESSCGAQETLTKPYDDYSACSFRWEAGSWSTPSACGATTRTRTVTCLRSDSTKATDGQCDVSTKPAASEQVSDTSACTYSWRYSDWTAPASCGPTIQTRVATCQRQDGVAVGDGQCATPHDAIERTGTDYSTCSHSWTTGAWSTPSACGQTTRMRSVTCTRSDGATVDDGQCGSDKPVASERTTDTSACQFSWVQTSVGTWSACVGGSQSRPVTAECRRSDGTVVTDAQCPTSRPPTSENRACTSPTTPTNPGTSPADGQIIFRRAIQVRPQN